MSAELVAVYGRRGTGKTTLARSLLTRHGRLIVFDPIGEWSRSRGIAACDTLEDVRRGMIKGWKKGFRLAWPVATDHIAQLHRLSLLLWAAQAPYESGGCPEITLVVDEMNFSYPVEGIPRKSQGFTRLVLQGRHRGIAIIGVTQRPALISGNFRGNVTDSYVLPLEDENDIALIRRKIGKAGEAELRALQPFCYLRLRNGQVERGQVKRPKS